MTVRAAIGIWKRDVLDSTEQRTESLALSRLRGRQRKSAHRAAVEAAVKCDELVSPRGVSRQFNGAFYCFRTRVGEKDLLAFGTWHRATQPFC